MSKARNIAALSTVEVGATADQTKADLNAIGVSGGRKNLIINGGFDVWQRGTSLAGATSYLADRWFNGTTETQTRQTFATGQTEVSGNPTYYHRGAGGASEWYGLKHRVEGIGVTGGQVVTLSYWLKGSSAFTNAPMYTQNFGSGGSGNVNVTQATDSVTTSWARYTQTFTVPSISGKTVGTGNYLQLNLVRANVANITIDLANVQLELGSVATDFEHRSYGEELALCQRYYQKTDTFNHFNLARYYASSGNAYNSFKLACTMRANPTFSQGGTWTPSSNAGYAGTPVLSDIYTDSVTIRSDNALSANGCVYLSNGYFMLDAEL